MEFLVLNEENNMTNCESSLGKQKKVSKNISLVPKTNDQYLKGVKKRLYDDEHSLHEKILKKKLKTKKNFNY